MGLALVIAGQLILRRRTQPLPGPGRQVQMLKRSLTVAAVPGVSSRQRILKTADPVTKTLVVGATAALLGWLAIARFQG